MRSHVRRVVVLTADVGEGHLAAARVVADDLRAAAPGIEVTTLDALELLGPVLRVVLRDAYRVQLRYTPWVFALLFGLFLRVRPLRSLGALVLAAFGARRMRRAIERVDPDLVVSTYPAATAVLGTLRRLGQLECPAYATVTDLAGAELWAHRGIDLHLVMHPALVSPIEREAGAASACAIAPLTGKEFRTTPDKREARAALGLPDEDRIVLVSGGGWGVGDLAGATAAAATLPDTTVVCLTGRDARLHAELSSRFAQRGNVRVLAFVDRMALLLAAADVLVHTTGGMTCLEAMTVGRPIVVFGPPAGHAPVLARAMDRLGIAAYARNVDQLRASLLDPPATVPASSGTPVADMLLAATRRDAKAAAPRSPVTVGLACAAAAVAAFLTVGSRSAFAVIAYPLDLTPESVVTTNARVIGLVVETSPPGAVAAAQILSAHHAHASFAFARAPSARLRRLLAGSGDQVIGMLRGAGIDDWLGAAETEIDGASRHLVLAPAAGVSAGQYLLARLAGAQLVAPATHLGSGAVIVSTGRSLVRVLDHAAHDGLRAEPVGRIAGGGIRVRLAPSPNGPRTRASCRQDGRARTKGGRSDPRVDGVSASCRG